MAWFNRNFYGSWLSDTIDANNYNNYILGFGGDDTIYARGGRDIVYGGSGNDYIDGGTGNDRLYGGWGNDTLIGNDGNDFLSGSRGDDDLFGGAGRDKLYGGSGNDFLDGGSGNDTLFGGGGNDDLVGGTGSDRLYGSRGDDFLNGGAGYDKLFGGRGNDTLDGGQGRDSLYGQSGNDTLIFDGSVETGDYNYFNGGGGVDTLKLHFSAEEFASQEVADDLQAFLSHLESNTNSRGNVWGPSFKFSTVNLRVYAIENLQVFVDGVHLDPDDAGPGDTGGNAPIATDDAYNIFENGSVSDSVTDNDTFDAGTTVTLISSVDSGTLILNPDGSFSFDPGTNFDALAEGETDTVSFTYELSGGGTTNQAVATITITGTNDAPTVSAPLTLTASEGSAYSVDLLQGATDVDAGDVLSLEIDAATLPAGATIVGTTLNFDANDSAYNALAQGEEETIVIDFSVVDSLGESVSQSLTITLSGTNDAPVVAAALSVTVSDDDASITVDLLEDASDVDNGAVLSVSNVSALTGGFTLDGTNLIVDPNHPDLQGLPAGNSIFVVTFDVIDEFGASVSQSVTVTVTSDNNAPTVAAALIGAATEDGESLTLDLLEGASDIDADAVLSVDLGDTVLPAGITLDGSNLVVDTSDPSFQILAVGEELSLVINYAVVDQFGASAAQTATITITGTNDNPAVGAVLTAAASEDGAAFDVDFLESASDVDAGAELSVELAPDTVLPAGVSLDGSTLSVDPANESFQSLGEGEELVLTVDYNVIDGNGGFAAQSVTLTITGTNDVPAVESALTASADEGDASVTIDLLEGASDADGGAVLTVLVDQLPDGFEQGDRDGDLLFDPNNSAYDALAAGEEQIIVIDYTIRDEQGAEVAQTLTVTLTGTNDAPVVDSALTEFVDEDRAKYL